MNIILILYLSIVAVSGSLQKRSINGKNAAERQFPYQVGLVLNTTMGYGWCGGTLIDNSWVLTAANCIHNATSVIVCLGSTKRNTPKVTRKVSNSNFIKYKDFDPVTATNNIALIKIPRVTYNKYIQKIKLPAISSNYSNYSGERATFSGWGVTSDSDTAKPTKELQYVSFKVIDNSVCARTYKVAEPSLLCATGITKGSSICEADYGGPLVSKKYKELIGIASFYYDNQCEKGKPSGFTRVTSFLPWIKEVTGISY